jgi:hypothetical protein
MGSQVRTPGVTYMDSSVLNTIKNVGAKYGIPLDILYPIVMTESGGNPQAHTVTSKEDSRGLFQVNIKAHPDANSGQLFNAEYNANYWIPQLVPAYNQGKAKGLTGADLSAYVERYGERPAWTSTVEGNIRKYYAEYTGGKVTATSSGGMLEDKAGYNNGTVTDVNGNQVATGGTMIEGVQGMFKTFMDNAKFSLTYAMLLLFLMFALYMVFVKGGK